MSKVHKHDKNCITMTAIEFAKTFINESKKRKLDLKMIETILNEMDVEDFSIFLAKIVECIADQQDEIIKLRERKQ